MKFRVDRDVLADAVAWAARSLPVRPSVPVLAGLLIEAGDEGLELSTFDYETSARATLAAEVADEGRALVSGRLLADICRSLPAKPVDMVLEGPRVSLTCGSARFTLQTLPVEDYPTLPPMPQATGTVRSDVFAHAVSQAVTAAGRDDMLPVLTGVRLEIDGPRISLLATDRFRLSQRELDWSPRTPDESLAALVPAKVLGDTARSLTARRRGHHLAQLHRHRRGHHRLRGHRRRRRTTHHDAPARRRVPQGPQPVPQRAPDHRPARQARPGRVGEARGPRRRAQHRRPARLQRRRADPRRRLRRRGAGVGVDRGHHRRRGHHHRASTRSSCSTASTAIDEDVVELAFTQASKPVVISGAVRRGRGGLRLPLPADAASRLLADVAGDAGTATAYGEVHAHRADRAGQDGRQHARASARRRPHRRRVRPRRLDSPTSPTSPAWSRRCRRRRWSG